MPSLRHSSVPLAKSAGGTERCGKAVFATTADPDYQALLKTFAPLQERMRAAPRDDMVRVTGP